MVGVSVALREGQGEPQAYTIIYNYSPSSPQTDCPQSMIRESLYGLGNKLLLRSMFVFSPASPTFSGLLISTAIKRDGPAKYEVMHILKKIYD